jgi:hypothetical protein
MLRLHKKLPNVLLPAVLVFFAILANPAAASGRKPVGDTLLPPALRDSFPDAVSYPAAPIADQLDSSRANSLRSLANLGAAGWWWRSTRHPFLDSVLPGIEVYRVPFADGRVTGPGSFGEADYASYRGKLYPLEKLNDLLQDAGLAADTANWPAIARVAALFALFGREFVQTESGLVARGKPYTSDREWYSRDPNAKPPPPDPIAGRAWTSNLSGGIGFPSLAILKVERQVPEMRPRAPVRVHCLVDEKPCTLDVYFSGGAGGWHWGPLRLVMLGPGRLLLFSNTSKRAEIDGGRDAHLDWWNLGDIGRYR